MTIRSTIVKASLTGVAGVMALSAALTVPSFAAAQSAQGGYYDSRGYYYDPCRRDTTQRETTGGLLGALAGAAVGSNLASHHGGRAGGAVLGGLLGAGVGASVGKSSAACEPGQARYASPPPPPQAYYGDRYEDRARYDDRYEDRDGDRYGRRYPVTQGQADPAACTLAESPIYLPDGRVQKRFVRVCPDSSGRYQVVE
jgi:hypothetical protein